MTYPARLLGDEETVAMELRPHWRLLALPVLVLLLTVSVAGFLAGALGSDGWRGWARWVVLAVAVVVLLGCTVLPLLRWLTTAYVFTNRRIIVRSGLLTRTGRDMPLSKVNNVAFRRTVAERLLGSGTLVVESASEAGGLVIAHIRDVESVQAAIYRLHEEDDAWRRGDDDPSR